MAVKTENDLTENGRQLWLKAMAAMELRNYGYAISLLQGVLHETPDFLAGRKMLRQAEASRKKKKSLFGGLSASGLSGRRAHKLIKKDPKAAMEEAEKMLEDDPHNVAANMLLKDAALACGFTEIATFALETLKQANPKDTKILHELGRHYYQTEQYDLAVDTYNEITEVNPADIEAIKAAKDAAARTTMQKGGWEAAESYRDVMKNREEAVSLEQQNRAVLSDEMIDRQLQELHAKVENEPGSVDAARRIASLYEQKENLEFAIQWYDYAAKLTNNSDAALVRKVADLTLRRYDEEVERLAAELEKMDKDSPDYQAKEAELATKRKERAEKMIEEAQTRVQRNPTDLQLRFELGEQLMLAERYQEAIPELQQARTNPHARIKSMNLLGKCYEARSMFDLAERQFTEAASEITAMDSNKKEILYNLGLVYEKMGKEKESIECMKQIYDADYGYRDVAKRVEASYADGDVTG